MRIKTMITTMVLSTMSLVATAQQLGSGIELDNLDKSARAADDFYQYACGGWMQKNPLPAAYSRYGAFEVLSEENNKRIKALHEESMDDAKKGKNVAERYNQAEMISMENEKLVKAWLSLLERFTMIEDEVKVKK